MSVADSSIPGCEFKKELQVHIVLCEPGQKARMAAIDNSLEALQAVVGGYVESIYPFDDSVAIICNEEGKVNGMALNRALRDSFGLIRDILVGPFLVIGVGEDDFTSLSQEQQSKYYAMFKYPERFFWDGKQIQGVKVESDD